MKKFFIITFTLLFIKLLLVLPAFITGGIINDLSNDHMKNLSSDLLLLLMIAILMIIIQPFSQYILMREVQQRVEKKSTDWFSTVMNIPFKKLKVRGLGEIASKIDRGIAAYEAYLTFIFSSLIPLLVEIGIITIALFISSNPYSIAIILITAAMNILLQLYLIKRRRASIDEVNDVEDALSEQTIDYLKGIKTIQLFKKGEYFSQKMQTIFSRYKNCSVKLAISSGLLLSVKLGLAGLSAFLILTLYGLYYIPAGMEDIGGLVTTLALVAQMMASSSAVAENIRQLDQMRLEYQGLKELMQDVINMDEMSQRELPAFSISVQPAFPAVIPYGTTIALVGASGAGKTTLLENIGNLVDGDVFDLAKHFPNMDKVSYLEQDNFIFTGTVLDNITLGDDIDKEHIKELLDRLELSGRIDLDSEVHGNGGTLSGGEKRRICFIRSFLHQTPVMLFDEPTAGLNHKIASKVWDLIFEGGSDSIIIACTHDTDILHRFDHVISINKISAMPALRSTTLRSI